ncbi:MAG: SPOR domain-containing protein [Gammaproteobacteria bacterium]|nr:SPOR domain-containing protein [Gammaproteobacteria bacterium]
MDEQTRYRVTGSLFLLALAIICLPMLFDGEGMASIELDAMEPPTAVPRITPMEEVAPASDFIARVNELRGQVDDDGFLVESGTLIGEPVLSDAADGASAWAIQVASFVKQENARKFRSELRDQGYEAFISTAKANESIHFRVAVGPLLNVADADELQVELSQLHDVQARIMAFSN